MKRLIAAILLGVTLIIMLAIFFYKKDPHFVIITPSYNNERYCLKNIQSVVDQTYNNWSMVIINDASKDYTKKLLQNYINQNNLQKKITLINNVSRQGALKNIFDTIHQCRASDIIITLDGDDWFKNEHVLQKLVQIYRNPHVWITYGQYCEYPGNRTGICRKLPDFVIKKQLFRAYPWVTSHLRTFYAWLFQKIKQEDLIYNGTFFPVTWDLAIMFPMLEMAANNHIRFIPDILYIYNCDNPLNDYKCNFSLQQNIAFYIRNKKKYVPLD